MLKAQGSFLSLCGQIEVGIQAQWALMGLGFYRYDEKNLNDKGWD
jgi:hypothetical protein